MSQVNMSLKYSQCVNKEILYIVNNMFVSVGHMSKKHPSVDVWYRINDMGMVSLYKYSCYMALSRPSIS